MVIEHDITSSCGTYLDPEADKSKYDVIRDVKAGILAYQLLKLLRQSNVLKYKSKTNQQPTHTVQGQV